MSLLAGQLDQRTIRRVLAHYDIGELEAVAGGGGTGGSKARVVTRSGTYLVRRRREEFSSEPVVRFDHSVIGQLGAGGVGCAVPLTAHAGASWVALADGIYEVTPWLEGHAFDPESVKQLTALGRSLGRFHTVAAEIEPEGQKDWRREDDPRDLLPVLAGVVTGLGPGRDRDRVRWLHDQLRRVETHLADTAYRALPQCVIHGDIHPGNVKFSDRGQVLFFDFDWCSRQACIRDVADVLMFFAFGRARPMDPDDIWSLTAPWTPNLPRARLAWQAYASVRAVESAEVASLPWLMRSRLIQARVSGMRKVSPDKGIRFLTQDIDGPLQWLDHDADAFQEALVRFTGGSG